MEESESGSTSVVQALTLPSQLSSPPRLRVVLMTIGSRGDVQPLIALGLRLRRDGHHVTIATHAEFEEFVGKYSLHVRKKLCASIVSSTHLLGFR
jgi:hypothetical protein